jgi:hypothetical protein
MLRHPWLHDARPPMNIDQLIAETEIDVDTRQAIEALVAEKRQGGELGKGPCMALFDALIAGELALARAQTAGWSEASTSNEIAAADQLFLDLTSLPN